MAQIIPRKAQNEVLGRFIIQNASDFADLEEFDRELRNLATIGDQSAE